MFFFFELLQKEATISRHRDIDGNISRSFITAIILLPSFMLLNITHILNGNKHFTIRFYLITISGFNNITHFFRFQWHTCIQEK